MLHNVKWPGMYLAVKKGKVHNVSPIKNEAHSPVSPAHFVL